MTALGDPPRGCTNLSFAHEVEARALHHLGSGRVSVGTEEDRCAEDAFKCCNQPAVLLAARVHTKAFQHLGGSSKSDDLTFLLHSESSEEDRYQAILPEGYPEFGMTRNLKHETAVAPLVHKLVSGETTQWQAAQHEWSRTECERLSTLLPLQTDDFNRLGLAKFLLRQADAAAASLL